MSRAWFALVVVWVEAASSASMLSITTLEGSGWQATQVALELTLTPPAFSLEIDELVTAVAYLRELKLTCTRAAIAANAIDCPALDLAWLDTNGNRHVVSAALRYLPAERRVVLDVPRFELAGGTVEFALELARDSLRYAVDIRGLALENLPGAVVAQWVAGPPPTIQSGSLSVRARGASDTHGRLSGDGSLALSDFTFGDDAGLRAGERLAATLDFRQRDERLEATLAIASGALYVEPVFVDFAAHPIAAEVSIAPSQRAFELRYAVTQRDLLQASGVASWSASGGLDSAKLELERVILPGAYNTYLKGLLIGTALSTLDTSGELHARANVKRGQLHTVTIDVNELNLEDQGGRYALYGVNGDLKWRAQGEAERSRIAFGGGYIYGAGFDAGALELAWKGENIDLLAPARIPLLGGALHIKTFAARDYTQTRRSFDFEAALEPIELKQLAQALDWPPFAGTLSGELPRLSYRDGRVSVGGTLRARAFDGDIEIDRFRVHQPFGLVPIVRADVRLRGIDLGQLTQVFAFGDVSGRLDGDLMSLRLVKGVPDAFDASFRSSATDDQRRRISQRAVDTISKVASGGSAALSTTFLRVFKHFGYERLGISCRLLADVCHMQGIEPAEQGYYIVRGRGLPRLDLIGHIKRVQWTRLIEQLRQALREGTLEVR